MKSSSVMMSDIRQEARDMTVELLGFLERVPDRDYANCVIQLQDAILDFILVQMDEKEITEDNYKAISFIVKTKYAEIMLSIIDKV